MGTYINNNLIRDEKVELETDYHWIIFLSIASFITLFLYPFYLKLTSEFAITNKRIIIKTGFIGRKTIEMNIHKIESVNVNQSVLGRLLGYGQIRIIGTGGSQETFKYIAAPLKFRKRFQENTL